MRTQVRIVAGSLRGRKLTFTINPNLRPTPQRVREALFSMLGDAVPERPFFDVFAGTGVIGLEALSRGASHVMFIERDARLVADIRKHLHILGVADLGTVVRADVYHWLERWQPPTEPVNLFLSPPFVDLGRRSEDMLRLLADLQQKVHDGSVVVLQSEESEVLDRLRQQQQWEERRYGRNHLLIEVVSHQSPAVPPADDDLMADDG